MTMQPGRELDSLVAMWVFGWTLSKEKHHVADPDGWSIRHLLIPPGGSWILTAYELEPGMSSLNIPIPHYSSNISDAWKVVPKIETRIQPNGRPSSEFTLQRCEDKTWRAGYMEFIDWMDEAQGETAAHAICLFALRIFCEDEAE